MSLKGLSSLAQHCRGRCWDECCACKKLGEILAHHKFRHVGRCGVGCGLQEKSFNVLNAGVNLTGRECLTPGAPGCFLGPTPSPLRMAPTRFTQGQGPAQGGTHPGKSARAPRLRSGTMARS